MTTSPDDPRDLVGHALEWRARGPWFRPWWELRERETVLVTLRREHWYGLGMRAEADGIACRLGRRGWLGLALTREGAAEPSMVRGGLAWPSDETTERLKLSRWRGDGPIERPDGRRWYWRQHGFIRGRHWDVLDERGDVLATFTRAFRPFRLEGAVRIGDGVSSRRDALEAAVFGWTLLLREADRRRHAAH